MHSSLCRLSARFAVVEKYGLLIGGADTHRYDLSSMVMLKVAHHYTYFVSPVVCTVGQHLLLGGQHHRRRAEGSLGRRLLAED